MDTFRKSHARGATVWTPRKLEGDAFDRKVAIPTLQHFVKALPRSARAPKFKAQAWVAPPRPQLAKPVVTSSRHVSADALEARAAELIAKADARAEIQPEPSTVVQLGRLLISKEAKLDKLLKDWDTKVCGEVLHTHSHAHARAPRARTTHRHTRATHTRTCARTHTDLSLSTRLIDAHLRLPSKLSPLSAPVPRSLAPCRTHRARACL